MSTFDAYAGGTHDVLVVVGAIAEVPGVNYQAGTRASYRSLPCAPDPSALADESTHEIAESFLARGGKDRAISILSSIRDLARAEELVVALDESDGGITMEFIFAGREVSFAVAQAGEPAYFVARGPAQRWAGIATNQDGERALARWLSVGGDLDVVGLVLG